MPKLINPIRVHVQDNSQRCGARPVDLHPAGTPVGILPHNFPAGLPTKLLCVVTPDGGQHIVQAASVAI